MSDSPARAPLFARKKWHFNIDVVGGCNLRCPSCAVGNSPTVETVKGYMKPELLEAIVDKAVAECRRVKFSLYNWTEPFLHPRLADIIRVIRSRGLRCGLSTNLNRIPNIDAVMEANPSYIKVSASGFNQEQYGVTHRGGNIETVKQNMRIVSEAKRRTGATTRLSVPFHRYLGNHEEERQMRAYAESLGFEVNPAWAYLTPLQKGLAYADPAASETVLTEEDRELVGKLALPLDRALAEARRHASSPCKLRDEQMTIDCQGNVMLCCTVYGSKQYQLGSYLDTPLAELQSRKYLHSQCESCMRNGLHVLYTYGAPEQFDQLALENVRAHYPDAGVVATRTLLDKPRGLRRLRAKLGKKLRKLTG